MRRCIAHGLVLVLLAAFAAACRSTTPAAPGTIAGAPAGSMPLEEVADPMPEIDRFILAEMERQGIVGLGLGVMRQGRIVYLRGYGWQNRPGEAGRAAPVRSAETRFRWASITKMMTAVAAFQLACADDAATAEGTGSRGCLDLDRDITAYLSPSSHFEMPTTYLAPCDEETAGTRSCPSGFEERPLAPQERRITLRQLLSHRSGIQHYRGPGEDGCAGTELSPVPPHAAERDGDFSGALVYLSGNPLIAKPGTHYCYSTFGYNLAGQVLEDYAGEEYEELIEERIAGPLGMTTLRPDHRWLPNRATGYKVVPRPGAPGGTAVVRDGDGAIRYKLPAGGFVSTVADLARFCRGLYGTELLSAKRRDAMWSLPADVRDERRDVRHGAFVVTRDGHRRVAHSGLQQKATTRLQLDPDEGLCVVVMTNTTKQSGSIDTTAIADGVEDVVRALPPADPD